ncbi:T9SS C-terminal target domain-containing protein [Sphingobacteriales bacterium UPWRP_1]|nr:hypothetical protein B6N25_11090 [Sphingobacteriales bacterium TSM_CSS]PSJ77528.1 T9SS C-terminal target domain-containing protein [Sphingobacteriales bacterium UPWRP_1]
MKKLTLLLFCIFLLGFTRNNAAAQPAGSLDPSFNNTGYYIHDFGFQDNLNQIVLQPDQKILATGVALTASFTGELKVLRLNTNGTPDMSFGTNGVFAYAGSGETYGYALALTADGKIIVGGIYFNVETDYTADMLLIRLDQSGNLDPDFGTNGVVIAPLSPFDDYLQALAIQPDGKIVVSGTVAETVGFELRNAPSIIRFLENGQLDTGFGTNGVVKFTPEAIDNELTSCIVQPDGKIVASGHFEAPFIGFSNFDILVVRVNENGTPDTTFGTNGKVITPVNGGVDDAFGMDTDNQGNIYVAGFTTLPVTLELDMVLLKYLSDGQLDPDFGNAGLVTFNAQPYDVANDLIIQPDGKILLAGSIGGSFLDPKSFALWRYLPNGSPDLTFGTTGHITTDVVANSMHEFNTVALQDNGSIVAAGKVYSGTNNDMIVARYINDLNTGIASVSPTANYLVYPNPSSGSLTLNLTRFQAYEKVVFTVYNLQGSIVAQQTITTQTSQSISLDLPAGAYVYTFTAGNFTNTGKLWVLPE